MRQIHGVLAVILCVTAPWAAFADDYTFKRVKVGEGVPGKRITVQIDPEEQAAYLAALPKVDPNPEHETKDDTTDKTADSETSKTPAPASSYAWFWDKVPVGISDVSGRFDTALAALTMGPEGQVVRAPRMQHMQTVAETYGTDILRATLDTNVSPALVLAVMGVESGGNPEAVSSAGAVGLMQLIPATAERFGVTDSTDPVQNIKGGVAYLDWLMGEFNNDPLMVIAAYNAGEGAVRQNGGVPPYAETRDYVPKVLAAWQVAQGLCVSAPMLVSDPCVFRTDLAGG
jgi:hypothetical protein